MAMRWSLVIYFMSVVWAALNGWVSACLMVADEIARGLRAGDIGPLPIGWPTSPRSLSDPCFYLLLICVLWWNCWFLFFGILTLMRFTLLWYKSLLSSYSGLDPPRTYITLNGWNQNSDSHSASLRQIIIFLSLKVFHIPSSNNFSL